MQYLRYNKRVGEVQYSDAPISIRCIYSTWYMIENLKKNITKLSALADGWTDEINPLERELFLYILRRMYESVRFEEKSTLSAYDSLLANIINSGNPTTQTTSEEDNQPDIEVELVMAEEEEEPNQEDVPVVAEEPQEEIEEVKTEEQQSESVAPQVTEEQPAESAPVTTTNGLGTRPRISRNVIDSIYGDGGKVQPKPASTVENTPKAEPNSIVAPKTVLGDVINNDAVRLGDALQSDTMDVATKIAANSVRSLREAMGINDKYVIMRDLFDDDPMRFEVAIDELDAQASFDDAMIYISGFSWNSASEGAKLLMNLLKLKFA